MQLTLIGVIIILVILLVIIGSLCSPYVRFRISIKFHKLGLLGIDQKVARKHLTDINEVFNSCGIEYFLTEGSALGAIRDGKLIPFDSDIDIGVFDREAVENCAIPMLSKRGFSICRRNKQMISVIRNMLYIDIMFVTNDGYCVDMPCEQMMKFISNKELVDMYGLSLWSLGKDYLAFNYGDDWRIPQFGKKPIK